jgi:hypothetical protein
MLRFAADENFNGDIVRGLLRRNPKLDIVRVQDVGLSGADDPCSSAMGRRPGAHHRHARYLDAGKARIRSNRSRSADATGLRSNVRRPCRTGYRRSDSPGRVQLRWRMERASALPASLRSSLRLQSLKSIVPVGRDRRTDRTLRISHSKPRSAGTKPREPRLGCVKRRAA